MFGQENFSNSSSISISTSPFSCFVTSIFGIFVVCSADFIPIDNASNKLP